MLYKFLKALVKITIWFYFKEKTTLGKHHIPNEGSLILVANHPSTFLDPLLVALSTKRPVYFLAKGSMFNSAFAKWLFRRFNMIPVYRKQDDPSKMNQNQTTFENCYRHLDNDGVLLIFPEGVSITEKKLKPIKTGAARIALGANAYTKYKKEVKIIPVGLHYENPHLFRSNVLVNIGAPIRTNKYADKDKECVNELTEEIKAALSQLVLDIQNKEVEEVSEMIHQLYNKEPSLETSFTNERMISAAVDKIAINDYTKFSVFKQDIVTYFSMAKTYGIDIDDDGNSRGIVIKTFILLLKTIIMLPVVLYGILHNIIPYYLTPRIANRVNKIYEYKGPIMMTVGMLLYLILYTTAGVIFYLWSNAPLLTLCYICSLPLSGLVAYSFYEETLAIKQDFKTLKVFSQQKEAVAELVLLRKRLLAEIEAVHHTVLDNSVNVD